MKQPHECSNIEEVRNAIDSIDREIISLIANRFSYVREVVKFKKADKDSIIAHERYKAVLQSRRVLAQQNGLDPDVIESVYKKLLDYFISEELKIIEQKGK